MFRNLISIILSVVILLAPYVVYGRVIISEISWMGTEASSYDEWIEIANIGNEEIDLDSGSGWTLEIGDNEIQLSGVLSSSGTLLLERTNQDTLPDYEGLLFTGGISNSGENIYLKDGSGSILDFVENSSGWCAGDSSDRKTMIRVSENTDCSAWQTFSGSGYSIDADGNIINGTPFLIAEEFFPDTSSTSSGSTTSTGSVTGSGSTSTSNTGSGSTSTGSGSTSITSGSSSGTIVNVDNQGNPGSSGTGSSIEESRKTYSKSSLLISEVNPQISPDWVEIYVNESNVDLSDCILTDLDGTDSFLTNKSIIPTKDEYFLVTWDENGVNEDLNNDINLNGVLDLYISDTGLSSTDDQLSLVCNDNYIDSVAWTNGDGEIVASEARDLELLISVNEWVGINDQNNTVRLSEDSYNTIGRNDFEDTDSLDDFEIFSLATPGVKNYHPNYNHDVFINEIYANPPSYDTGKEWIELFNKESYEVDLAGWMIKDNSKAYIFPPSISKYRLSGSGFLAISSGESRINISNSDLEIISLYSPDGILRDQVTLPMGNKKENESYARSEEGIFYFTKEITKGRLNSFFSEEFSLKGVFNLRHCQKTFLNSWQLVISEIHANPSEVEKENEFIELKNIGKSQIPLICFYLEDFSGSITNFMLPNKFIYPDQYMVFYRLETNITLGNSNDGVILGFHGGGIADQYFYNKTSDGYSLSKTGSIYEKSYPTPGKDNDFWIDTKDLSPSEVSSSEKVVYKEKEKTDPAKISISELMINPEGVDTGKEWVEFELTQTGSVLDYKLEVNGVKKSFKETIMTGSGFLVYNFSPLRNSGGEIKLLFNEKIIEEISYDEDYENHSFAKNGSGFVWTAYPTPGNPNVIKKITPKSKSSKSIFVGPLLIYKRDLELASREREEVKQDYLKFQNQSGIGITYLILVGVLWGSYLKKVRSK